MTTKATIYLDARLHRAAKIKAAQTNNTLSAIMSCALKESLREDAVDLAAIRKREAEPTRSFEAVLKDLKRDRLL
jgi:predicted transcriptional regulator